MLTSPQVTIAGSKTSSFTTIDDCLKQARQLLSTLGSLAQQKHPLSVRKGSVLRTEGKGVERMTETQTSKVIKAGSRTYFFDVKQTKEGKPYLMITESRFHGEGKARERISLTVFPEQAQAFMGGVREAVESLSAQA